MNEEEKEINNKNLLVISHGYATFVKDHDENFIKNKNLIGDLVLCKSEIKLQNAAINDRIFNSFGKLLGADEKKIKRTIYEIFEVPPKIRFEYSENKKFAVCLTRDVDDIYPALSHTLLSSLHYMQNLNFKDSKIRFLGTLKEKNSALTGILKKERLDKGGENINKFSAQEKIMEDLI